MPSAFGVSWDSLNPAPLGTLMESYSAGTARAREDALRQQLAGGMPRGPDGQIDWNAAIDLMARTGNLASPGALSNTLGMAKQADELRALGQLSPILKQFGGPQPYGGGAQPPGPQSAAPPAPGEGGTASLPPPPVPVAAATAPPPGYTSTGYGGYRPKVASSDRVMGDDDAVAAGYYDPDKPPVRTAGVLPVPPGGATPPPPPMATGAQPGATPVQTVSYRPPGQAASGMPPGQGIGGPGDVPVPPQPPMQVAQAAPPPPPPPPPPQAQPGQPTPAEVRAQAEMMRRNANPFAQQAAQLSALLPRLPPHSQQAMAAMVQHLMRGNDLTDNQKQWIGDVLSGGTTESYSTWNRLNRAAEAGVLTSPEGIRVKEHEARLEVDRAQLKEITTKVNADRMVMPLIEQIKSLAHGTPEGFAGTLAPTAQKVLAALGIPWAGGVRAELFQAVSRRFIPSVRDPGAASNLEQAIWSSSVPSLQNSAQGRVLIANFLEAQILRQREIAEVYRNNLGKEDLGAKLDALEKKNLLNKFQQQQFKDITGVSLTPPRPDAMLGADPSGKAGWYIVNPQTNKYQLVQ